MYCSKCGKEIPDGTMFCSFCGSAQKGATSNSSSSNKKDKKSSTIIISLVVVAVAFIIGKFLIAPSMLSEPDVSSNNSNYQQDTNVEQSNSDISVDRSTTVNSSYSEIFSSRYIVESPSVFFSLESASFAKVDDTDGSIEKMEFGYDGDIIKEMINTFYYPVSDLDDAQKNSLDSNVKAYFANIASVDFCSATYDMGNNYYVVTFHFTGLDVAENIQKMSEFGIISSNQADLISMSETESGLISSGYIKK